MTIDHTHDPLAVSWVPGADDHPDFPIQNLPLGVFSQGDGGPRIGCAIGEWIIDLAPFSAAGGLPSPLLAALAQPVLNDLFALPPAARRELRHLVFAQLSAEEGRRSTEPYLVNGADCRMHLPLRVGDYTDFYVGIHHAMNIGKQLRPDNPLLPNYKHVPIGYHGRASSIRVSGTPVTRPNGQLKPADQSLPQFGPTRRLDYELELGVWMAGENPLGEPVPIDTAWDRVAGLGILNDWSARDIQAWEYQPLGPFLAKNFQSTVSPWVITAEALAPFRIAPGPRPDGDPEPLPYLVGAADRVSGGLALDLEVFISTARMRAAGEPPARLSSGPAANMYWTVAQMIAHHTSNGCNLQPGDLLGTGTISGPEPETFGSLMELSGGGAKPIALPGGENRGFLEDGDEIAMAVTARRDGFRAIGFGPCTGTILTARR
jgi:fumarylacetoacetase